MANERKLIAPQLCVASFADIEHLPLQDIGQLRTGRLNNLLLDDAMLAPEVLVHNLLIGPATKQPKWQEFLNLCTFIESFVLNNRLILRLPTDGPALAAHAVFLGMLRQVIQMPADDFDAVIKLGVGFSEPQDSHVYLASTDYISEWWQSVCMLLDGESSFEAERLQWKEAITHLGHESLASRFGCSYSSGYTGGGIYYQAVTAARIELIARLTPRYLYELIKQALHGEIEELQSAGWRSNVQIPPLALIVLDRCKGEKKHFGEVLLEERDKAAKFRGWTSELRAEFIDAQSIREATLLHSKLKQVLKEFAGSQETESWKVTSWNGLLAAFPKSVWDGLSREDIDLKALVGFLAAQPLKMIAKLVRQRNYLYLLDVRTKFRRMRDYNSALEQVFGTALSAEDVAALKEANDLISDTKTRRRVRVS